jgi:peptidoglycan/LPS O-acetylase OafA/YrhL
MQRQPAVQFLPELSGLRFVAAFSIMFGHIAGWIRPFKSPPIEIEYFVENVVIIGMPLFFVMSGFIMQHVYGRSFRDRVRWSAVKDFAIARFSRLYPLYLFFFALDIALYEHDLRKVLTSAHWRAALGYALTMTQSWVFKVVDGTPIYTQYWAIGWSVSTEIFFYLAFPLISILVWRITRIRSAVLLLLGCFVAFYLYQYLVYAYEDKVTVILGRYFTSVRETTSTGTNLGRWFSYISPYSRLPEFITGCLAARLAQLAAPLPIGPREARWGGIATVAICGAIAGIWLTLVILLYVGLGPHIQFLAYLHENYLLAPLIAGLLFCVTRYRSWVRTLLSCAAFVYLGEISYSLYLSHPLIPGLLRVPHDFDAVTVGTIAHYALYVLAGLVMTVVISVGTYTLIEAPCRAYIRRALHTRTLVIWRPAEAVEAALAESEERVASVAMTDR